MGALLGFGISTFIKLSDILPQGCGTLYRHDTTVKVRGTSIPVEVASSDAQREKGLSGRKCIGSGQAMLFEFNKAGYYPFWMKDMKFPIDIVWIGADHKAVTIKPNISPSTYPQTFTSEKPAKYVLELGAGRAKQLNITKDTTLNF